MRQISCNIKINFLLKDAEWHTRYVKQLFIYTFRRLNCYRKMAKGKSVQCCNSNRTNIYFSL